MKDYSDTRLEIVMKVYGDLKENTMGRLAADLASLLREARKVIADKITNTAALMKGAYIDGYLEGLSAGTQAERIYPIVDGKRLTTPYVPFTEGRIVAAQQWEEKWGRHYRDEHDQEEE